STLSRSPYPALPRKQGRVRPRSPIAPSPRLRGEGWGEGPVGLYWRWRGCFHRNVSLARHTDQDQLRADSALLADLSADLDDGTGDRRGQLDGRLVGHHLD